MKSTAMNEIMFSDTEMNSYVKEMIESRLAAYGFIKYAYAVMNKKNTSEMLVITNIPDWVGVYLENGYQNIDPVIISALNRISCFSWDENLTVKDKWKLPKIFNSGKNYNIISGYTFVLHDQNDNLVVLSLMVNKFLEPELYTSIEKHKENIQYLLISAHEILLQVYQKKLEERKNYYELTSREAEIFNLCRIGKTYPEIANILNITVSTVKFHMSKIVKKLGVKSAKHAIALSVNMDITQGNRN
jgi:LuxR family quorum-sensing system transcriptional regulator ExpR